MAADTTSEETLTDAFLEERNWVSQHISMDMLWNDLRTQKMITKKEEDRLKKFMVEEEQVAELIDTLQKKEKLGVFFKLLRKDHVNVITKLEPLIVRLEAQRSVDEAVKDQSDQGQSQSGAAEGETQMDWK